MHCSACGFLNEEGMRFCGRCAAPLGGAPPAAGAEDAERRQITVLFCDLVDSTPLSERLDPEDLRDIVRAYQDACAEAIVRFDGYIAQYLGDGILAYFGYPHAHEDDAQRAIRTALASVDAVRALSARLPAGTDLAVRVGIHTGLVVVGEVGVGDRHEQVAFGETPNIAARLQNLAEPNTIVISADTHRITRGYFDTRPLGLHTVKGISRPIAVFRVERQTGVHGRLDVPGRLTPLVGRTTEVELLRLRWEQARRGAGQAVLIGGEAGIGKSRLVRVARDAIAGRAALRIELQCSAYHQHSALYPVIAHLERVLRFDAHDTPEAKLAKLAAVLSADGLSELAPLVTALLSLPHPLGYPELTLTPDLQRRRTFDGLAAWLLATARRQPTLVIIEDLQWADPSTLELVGAMVEQTAKVPILALLTFRPDFSPPWRAETHVLRLDLGRLGGEQIADLAAAVSGGRSLPAEVLDQVVTRTDGVPLFVEELIRAVLESDEVLVNDGHDGRSGMLPPPGIPATLQELLMARIDRLESARELAQLAAALGREFDLDLLRAVAAMDEGTLQRGLTRLVEEDLLRVDGAPPRLRYRFRHALLQEAAYQSLLRRRRRDYHARIATALEQHFPEVAATQPEIVAHHYTEAGNIERAIAGWQQASRRAVGRSAYQEGARHLARALELLGLLPETPDRAGQELALEAALGNVLMATKGYGATEVGQAFARARELSRQVAATPRLFDVLSGLWTFHNMRGDHREAHELALECLDLAERAGEPRMLLWADLFVGQTLMFLGEYARARAHLERAHARYDPERHRPRRLAATPDPAVVALQMLAHVLEHLGYLDQALARAHAAREIAGGLSHVHSLVMSNVALAQLLAERGEEDAALAAADQAAALARDEGLAQYVGAAAMVRGWALVRQGRAGAGAAMLREGLDAWRATGAENIVPYWLGRLATAHGALGQIDAGLAAIEEALTIAARTGEGYGRAQAHLAKGALLLARADPDREAAERCFHEALAVARGQAAKTWELSAALALARLWRDQGRADEARDLLDGVYGWFTEGFDTADLRAARALLDELRQEAGAVRRSPHTCS